MYLRLLPIGESRSSDLFSETLEPLTTQEIFDPVGMTGLSPVGINSTSTSILTTSGLSAIGLESIGRPPYILSGNSPVGLSSSSSNYILIETTGTASIGVDSTTSSASPFELYSGELSDILIPIELSGLIDPIFPPPTPPVNFDGLDDPTVAPTLLKSDSAEGRLPAGTYRYSYAAWKGSKAQATAPSPTADITLTTEDTVTLTYPTIAGADGYLVYREDL